MNPTEWKTFSTSGFTLLPLIASIITNNTLPPSNAGNGIALITAKFMLKYDVRYKSCLNVPALLTTVYIPIGPDNADKDNLPVNKLIIISNIVDTILPNLVKANFNEGKNPLISLSPTPIPNTLDSVPSSFILLNGVI